MMNKKMVLLFTILVMMFMLGSCVNSIPCAAYAEKSKPVENNKG